MRENHPGRPEAIVRREFARRAAAFSFGCAASFTGAKIRAADLAASDVIGSLSAFMSKAADTPLPPAVVEKVKFSLLDTCAAILSGSQLPPGRFAIDFARSYGGPAISMVGGSNVLCGPIEAAAANGILAHADETDDTHPPSQSHPACSVVPSALAIGEKHRISGEHFVRAIALGYDIGPRVTMTLGGLQYRAQSHRSTHSIAGTFGSAAAAGCAAKLSAVQMRWLLSYASQQASGIASWQRDPDHIEKAFDFGGMPARNGVTAALMVEAGGTGVSDVFTGADNFFQAYAPGSNPSGLIDQLGERFEVLRTEYKKWTVGSPIEAVLDAMENLVQKRGVQADQVKQVRVRVATNEASVVDNRDIPSICLQHMVAVMLVDRKVTFDATHDIARMKDPEILKQRAKVLLMPDEDLERLMPRRIAVVTIVQNDGRELSERVDAVRGTSANPMSKEDIVSKARDLIVPVMGAARTGRLIETVFAIEKVRDITELRPLLQATVAG
jgi:2-methylcitrate dehydratase PrpD